VIEYAFSLAVTLFLVANPIGNSPTILSLVKNYDFDRQRKIVFREAMISLTIAYFFLFFGEVFLSALKISRYALTLTGGIVLFLVALQMIFHKPETAEDEQSKQEPFIVPIATPLISGPGLMTIIMVSAAKANSMFSVFLAITIAWVGVTGVLVAAPYIQKLVGKRGMAALEQVMGMILGLISMGMIVRGAMEFVATLK
jgi:multiple antibiotic resistance protein